MLKALVGTRRHTHLSGYEELLPDSASYINASAELASVAWRN